MDLVQDEDLLLLGDQVQFRRDDEGNVLLQVDGREQVVANVTGAFPLSRRQNMISLRDREGREIGILDDVRKLDEQSRTIVKLELERSYFMPRIMDIFSVKEALSVVTWEVRTNKGLRTIEIRHVRKNIQRIGQRRFVIKDVDGNRYEIRDWINLPSHGQKLIEPYL